MLYVGFAFHQTVSPWGAPHHAAFIGILKSSAVVTGELGGSAAVLLATMALLVFRIDQPARLWKQLLQLGGTLAMFEAVFWGTAAWKIIRQGTSVSEGAHVGVCTLLAGFTCCVGKSSTVLAGAQEFSVQTR